MKRVSIIVLGATLMLLGAAVSRAEPAEEIGKRVLEHYQKAQAALAADSIEGVREAAERISDTVKPCDCSLEESAASQALVEAARGVVGADLATLREQLKPLSRALPAYLKVTGVDSAQLYYCPIVKAYWLQPKEEGTTRNPYYGKAMQSCGVKVERVAG